MRVKAYKAFSDYAIIFLVQIRKGIKFTMNRQEKRALWHKKQDKAKAQTERNEKAKQKDKQFIYNQTKLQDNKANKTLKELRNMKKNTLKFDLIFAKDINDESIALIGNNLHTASEKDENNGKTLVARNAVHAQDSLLTSQEKLIEDIKAFGGFEDNELKELKELIENNKSINNGLETIFENKAKGEYSNNQNKLLEDLQKLIGYDTEITKSENKPNKPNKPNNGK